MNNHNPYAKTYLSKKSRRNLKSSINDSSFINPSEPNCKKLKFENQMPFSVVQDALKRISRDTIDYNDYVVDDHFRNFDNFHELNNVDYEKYQNLVSTDADLSFMSCHNSDENLDEYSLDYIDENDTSIIDNLPFLQNHQEVLYICSDLDNDKESQIFTTQQSKSRRKQGIVGRPTLSSPQRLMVPDNVYSSGNCMSNDVGFCPEYNNFHNNSISSIRKSSHIVNRPTNRRNNKLSSDTCYYEYDDPSQRSVRPRPRILSKPSIHDATRSFNNNYSLHYYATEQEAIDQAQKEYAHKCFALNLVARAERQGSIIDKNKIPNSIFEPPVYEPPFLTNSNFDDQFSGVAEIKESEQIVSQPATTTVNISETKKQPNLSVHRHLSEPLIFSHPSQLTASELLKQKWKAANIRQNS